MKKTILISVFVLVVLAIGHVTKLQATEPVKDNIRDMASCGTNCFCCLNNTYTSCGAASCSGAE